MQWPPKPDWYCAYVQQKIEAREFQNMTVQDNFARDNIDSKDVLIVSVGGNDIALKPEIFTAANVACLAFCFPTWLVRSSCCLAPSSVKSTCLPGAGGCFFGCCCGMPLALPPCLGYMVHLFRDRTERYIRRLLEKQKPRLILVNMV